MTLKVKDKVMAKPSKNSQAEPGVVTGIFQSLRGIFVGVKTESGREFKTRPALIEKVEP